MSSGGTAVSTQGGTSNTTASSNSGGYVLSGGSPGSTAAGTLAAGGAQAGGGTVAGGGMGLNGGTTGAAGSAATGGYLTGGTVSSGGTTATGGSRLGCFIPTLTDNNVNVYVIKDAAPTGADTEGSLFVGGNLTAASYVVGYSMPVDCTKYALVVGGNAADPNGAIRGGKAAYGGSTVNATGTSFDCGGFTHESPIDFAALELQVENFSLALSKLPSNGTVSFEGSDVSGSLVFTGTDPVINVFSTNASELTVSAKVNFPEGSTVVINVAGTTATGIFTYLNGNTIDSVEAQYVIWNFYQATTLTGTDIRGSVLAPLATMSGSVGQHSSALSLAHLELKLLSSSIDSTRPRSAVKTRAHAPCPRPCKPSSGRCTFRMPVSRRTSSRYRAKS